MNALRPYQIETRDAALAAIAEGCRTLIYCPTGGGKTVVAASLVRERLAARPGERIAFVAHREELINQAWAKLREWGVGAGVVWARDIGRLDYRRQVQVCSIQTLVRRLDLDFGFGGIIWDECHHLPATTYQTIASAFPGAWHIGLTATPDGRSDGQLLGQMFDVMIRAASVSDLIAQGWLVRPDYVVMRAVAAARPDEDDEAAGARASAPTIIGSVVDEWGRHARGLPSVYFGYTVDHAERMAEAFRQAGARFRCVHGEMGAEERGAILRALSSGQLDGVTNCNVLTEGWDFPACRCVGLARSFGSFGAYIQAGGRGLRPWPGKSGCRLIDHGGNFVRHGRLEADREIRLHDDAGRDAAVREAVERRQYGRAAAIVRELPGRAQVIGAPAPDMIGVAAGGPAVVDIKRGRRAPWRELRR